MSTRYWWILRIAALGMVIATMGWLTVGTDGIFVSPDESANAFFSQTFAETGSMLVSESLNAVAQGVIHPRSTIAPGTALLPTSFLGFPFVTGVLRYTFGPFGQFAFTPIVAASGVAALWWMVRRLTKDERLADCSAFFVLIHPAFWYYGARVMMPNVAFVSLLVIGVACFVLASIKRSFLFGFLAGAIVAIALTMRLVEAPIVMIVAMVAMIAYRKLLPWKAMCGAVVAGAMVLGAYLVANSAVYGSALTTGYTLPDARSVVETTASSTSVLTEIGRLLLPFGFHPRAIVANAFRYGFLLYPLLSALAVIGAYFAWTTKEHQKAWRTFVVCLVVASLWMVVVYGSWSIADNPDPKAITIGNSHVRYWLPLFVAASVLAGLAFFRIRERMTHGLRSTVGSIALIVIIITTSVQTVFLGPDGLLSARAAAIASIEKRTSVLEHTESDAVVIVDRADKYLFPHRRVIVPLRADSTYAAMPVLAPIVPLYYFGITFPESDLTYLNEIKLAELGLMIEPVTTVHDETLYRITARDRE